MPPIKEHIQVSLKRTGKGYKELHEWIDEEYKYSSEKKRHEITNILNTMKIVREKFGDEAISEFLQHIKDDYENNRLLKLIKKLRKFKFW